MSTALFVTCGRGLSTIATEEIKEKIPNVCDIQPRGEGKLSFTINHIPCAPQPESSTGGANEDEHTQKEVVLVDCDTVGEKDVKVTKKQEDTKYVNAIVPVFKLKLVERIFLLLHCEEFGNDELASVIKTPNTEENCCEKLSGHEEISGFEQTKNLYKMLSLDEISSCGSKIMTPKSIIKDYENKLMEIIKSTEWRDIARRVQMLRNYQDLYAGDRVLCHNPNTCPGSVTRRVNKQQLSQKHKPSISSGVTKNFHYKCKAYKRTLNFDTTEKHFGGKNGKRRKFFDEGLSVDVNSKREVKLNCVSNQHCPSIPSDDEVNLKCGLVLDESEMDKQVFSHTMSLKKEQVSPEITEPVKSTTFQATVSCENDRLSEEIPEKSTVLVPLNKDEISYMNVITNKTVETLASCEKISKYLEKTSKPQESSNTGLLEHSSTKFHTDMSKSEPVSFRVSCRISGPHKTVLTADWLTHNFVHQLKQVMESWITSWREPMLDFYVNITNSHFIIGLSLAQRSLSLRRYIPHLTLRSTICYLMAKLSQIPPGGVLLDPMCGGGTILLEAATNFEVGHVIASDLSAEQLEVARCNLRNLSIPASLLHAHAAALPLHSTSVDAVICDFPFGQKYKVEMDSLELLRAVLAECQRVLVFGGRAVFLTSTQEHQRLLRLTSHSVSSLLRNQVPVILTLEREDYVALGETSAYVVVLLKEMSKT